MNTIVSSFSQDSQQWDRGREGTFYIFIHLNNLFVFVVPLSKAEIACTPLSSLQTDRETHGKEIDNNDSAPESDNAKKINVSFFCHHFLICNAKRKQRADVRATQYNHYL